MGVIDPIQGHHLTETFGTAVLDKFVWGFKFSVCLWAVKGKWRFFLYQVAGERFSISLDLNSVPLVPEWSMDSKKTKWGLCMMSWCKSIKFGFFCTLSWFGIWLGWSWDNPVRFCIHAVIELYLVKVVQCWGSNMFLMKHVIA